MVRPILIPRSIKASKIDSLNRSFISAFNMDNGGVLEISSSFWTPEKEQVWKFAVPGDYYQKGLWMAYSPEDAVITDKTGNQYKVGNLDPRSFTNVANIPFSGFKPQVGDIIFISEAGIIGEPNKYAVQYLTNVISEKYHGKLGFASKPSTGLSFKVLGTEYVTVAGANGIGSQRVKGYLLECVLN